MKSHTYNYTHSQLLRIKPQEWLLMTVSSFSSPLEETKSKFHYDAPIDFDSYSS